MDLRSGRPPGGVVARRAPKFADFAVRAVEPDGQAIA